VFILAIGGTFFLKIHTVINIGDDAILHVEHTQLVNVYVSHFHELWEVFVLRLFAVGHYELLNDSKNAEAVGKYHILNIVNVDSWAW